MGKSTLILIAIAALGLGALIGVSLVEGDPPAESPDGTVVVASTGGAPVFRFFGPEEVTLEHDEWGQVAPVAPGENFAPSDRKLKSETITISLGLDESVEYKALMEQGDVISFSWVTDGGDVYYDFHAHDEAFGEEFFSRYQEGEGTSLAGSIMAAYSGQHGWFWLNIADGPTTVTLLVNGFYDEIVKIDVAGY